MAKFRPLEQQLAALHALRACPNAPEARAEFARALASKTNLLAAKAATIAGDFKIADLTGDLRKAFERFMAAGAGADRGCAAKTAIAKALSDMEVEAPSVFLAGLHYTQPEASYGGSVDTAAELRGHCAFGLVRMNYRDALAELTDLLMDPEMQTRIAAVRAVAGTGRDEAMLLLRLKLLAGDREPDVMSEGFLGLVQLSPAKAVRFIERFLTNPEPAVAEAAALAIGASRLKEGFGLLQAHWKRGPAVSREVLLLAIAFLRLEESLEFLISLARGDNSRVVADAVKALGIYKHDEAVRKRVEAIVSQQGDELVRRAHREAFG